MPDILVRNLKPDTVKRLKARAKRNGRSFQGEAKLALEQAAGAETADIAEMFSKWKKKFAGRKFSDSTELIREDRSR